MTIVASWVDPGCIFSRTKPDTLGRPVGAAREPPGQSVNFHITLKEPFWVSQEHLMPIFTNSLDQMLWESRPKTRCTHTRRLWDSP
jgi:hypothetical protein